MGLALEFFYSIFSPFFNPVYTIVDITRSVFGVVILSYCLYLVTNRQSFSRFSWGKLLSAGIIFNIYTIMSHYQTLILLSRFIEVVIFMCAISYLAYHYDYLNKFGIQSIVFLCILFATTPQLGSYPIYPIKTVSTFGPFIHPFPLSILENSILIFIVVQAVDYIKFNTTIQKLLYSNQQDRGEIELLKGLLNHIAKPSRIWIFSLIFGLIVSLILGNVGVAFANIV